MYFQKLLMESRKDFFCEFIGTFLLVFFGTGSVIIGEEYNGIVQAFGIGVVFGLTVWFLILCLGKVSDCHINPAVTLVFFINKQIALKKAIFYVFFQLLGAVMASLVLRLIFWDNQNLGNTLPSGSWQESFVLELFLSSVLMFVILITTTKVKLLKFAPFLIGFTVFLEAWLAGPICGASMNPARSFGPGIISQNITFLWLYFIAPFVGMFVALLFYKGFMMTTTNMDLE